MHKYKIWQGKNGRWFTHVMYKGKRKLVSKGTLEQLENYIKEFYKGYTVEETFYTWLNRKWEFGEIGRNTYDRYEYTFIRYFEPVKALNIKHIDYDYLETFIKTTIRDKQLTAKMWGDMRIVVRGIWKLAKRRGYTDLSIEDFFNEVELSPRMFRRKDVIDEEQVFTVDEVAQIVKYISENQVLPTDYGILLALMTGLRAGEICTLRYSDLDRDALNVVRTEIRYKDGKTIVYDVKNATKGKNGRRRVYLAPRAVEIVEKLHDLSQKDALFDCHAEAFTNRLYRICDSLGIKKRSLHKCRKTYATMLVRAGVSDLLIAKMLGHTDPVTTYRHYVFANEIEREEKDFVVSALAWLTNG